MGNPRSASQLHNKSGEKQLRGGGDSIESLFAQSDHLIGEVEALMSLGNSIMTDPAFHSSS